MDMKERHLYPEHIHACASKPPFKAEIHLTTVVAGEIMLTVVYVDDHELMKLLQEIEPLSRATNPTPNREE